MLDEIVFVDDDGFYRSGRRYNEKSVFVTRDYANLNGKDYDVNDYVIHINKNSKDGFTLKTGEILTQKEFVDLCDKSTENVSSKAYTLLNLLDVYGFDYIVVKNLDNSVIKNNTMNKAYIQDGVVVIDFEAFENISLSDYHLPLGAIERYTFEKSVQANAKTKKIDTTEADKKRNSKLANLEKIVNTIILNIVLKKYKRRL